VDEGGWPPASSRPPRTGFTTGPPVEAVLTSAAVPRLLPPVKIGDEHLRDGRLVHSIPVGHAVALAARTVYVLHVGRIEQPLRAPRRPWEVKAVTFETARWHRFAQDVAELPPEVCVRALPTGQENRPDFADPAQLRYRDSFRARQQINRAYEASAAYLAGNVRKARPGG
jgi:NTE family protein